MIDTMSIFDLLPLGERERYLSKKSTDWKWSFKDYPKHTNGIKVFSCFACGGGSTMGYKLAGCEVLGCVEIDPKMMDMYVQNHHPKYHYCMDIRDFNKIPNDELPEELFHLDILDGSPPCTTFSMAGDREESWGKKKKFREGQKEQTLDDLSFVFIETVKKLKPKVVIMENVEGLLLGEAFQYVRDIYDGFKAAGYRLNHWLMKGENMGVPQTRHRVFFVGIREDLDIDPGDLNMVFDYEPVTYETIKDGHGRKITKSTRIYELIQQATETDVALCDVVERVEGKRSLFNYKILNENLVFPTLTAGSAVLPMRRKEMEYCTSKDMIHAQTFPEDYDFINGTPRNVQYVCGMSVPPVMMKRVVTRLIDSGVFDYKKGEKHET